MPQNQKLPALKFCNKEGAGRKNPKFGCGALGNELSGHMFYSGNDKKDLVTLTQMMLSDLGYDIGPSGIDGIFGYNTENAVKEFQKNHRAWDDAQLNIDGLIGPRTSDALNREMVRFKEWYDYHQTEFELTTDFELMTVKSDTLNNPVPIEVHNSKKVRMVILGEIQKAAETLCIRLHDGDSEPMTNVQYRLHLGDQSIEDTSEDGRIKATYPIDQCIQCKVEWGIKDDQGTYPYKLNIALNCQKQDKTESDTAFTLSETGQSDIEPAIPDKKEEEDLAKARLNNLGYNSENKYDDNVRAFQRDYGIRGEDGLLLDGSLPPKTKNEIWDIFENKERKLNASRLYHESHE